MSKALNLHIATLLAKAEKMKNLPIIAVLLALLAASCGDTPHFKVRGSIDNAAGRMLYVEYVGVAANEPLDSMLLDEGGSFSFNVDRYDNPEFFRLRVGSKFVNFVVDSTETVDVKGDYATLENSYEITPSEDNDKIRELSLKQNALQASIDDLMEQTVHKEMVVRTFNDSVAAMLSRFKDDVARNYIFKAPNKLYSYFALFMRINDFLVFDPYNNRDDIKCFAAVATSMERLYPHADRTKHLSSLTLRGMRNTRAREGRTLYIPEEKVNETGIINIALCDADGNEIKLSSLIGQTILLDFTVQQSPTSVGHNLALREMHDKYKGRGLAIYQVSLDADQHYWLQATDNLPWTCVWDPEGVYSPIIDTYNIKTIPSMYLIKPSGDIDRLYTDTKDVEKALRRIIG